MPVSRLTAQNYTTLSFASNTTNEDSKPLRIPQARVLNALMPTYPEYPPSEWPLITRAQLAVRAGYTAISGSVTRALNGIRITNTTSGDPHPGLLDKGMVEQIVVDVEGVTEVNYRITREGIAAFQRFIASGRKIPPVRDAALCINDRYLTR